MRSTIVYVVPHRTLGIEASIDRQINNTGKSGKNENRESSREHEQHGHFDFLLLNFLANIFGRPSHHQTSYEHRKHGIHEHPVQSSTNAAKNNLSQLNV